MITALAGFAAGSIHVLSGPDHLAAVSPLALESNKPRWTIGFRWGLGHTGGVFLVGLIALASREVIPLDYISSISERLVGVVLIAIGVWGLHKALFKNVHTHQHAHDGTEHVHIHIHGTPERHSQPDAHRHTHAAFAVGIIHGLAGSSHLLGVLPALLLPTRVEALTYLLFFGMGTICAMMIFTSFLGLVVNRFAHRGIKIYKQLLIATSAAAIGIGGVWLYF
jgi:sulfite exporter TauE/SafE